MKLYIYDHCPFCTRTRMIFGLKQVPVTLDYFLENDVGGPTALVGKKTTPILQKEDGTHMAESMDIVHYIDDRCGEPIVQAVEGDNAYEAWWKAAASDVFKLAIPRLAEVDLPEFATPEAREAFKVRQTGNFGDLPALLADSEALITKVEGHLRELEPILAQHKGINEGDFYIFPLLRALSITKGVQYPETVQAYMTRMAQDTGVNLHTDMAF